MPENEEQVPKVVTNLNAGVAKPIPINANDAVAIAREQAAYQQTVDALNNNSGATGATNNPGINNVVQPTLVGQEQQQIDLNQLNQVNDLVKVVDVKYSKKTIFILVGIIAIIIIIIILELPMLMGE
ncbi:MAG: hypothetical protein OSJ70_04075 [Bacilli bacterium]|nr:hypothetical protein [Bacilli bacterium]